MIDTSKKLSENFTLSEFLESATADKKGIKNTPTLLDIYHMEELCKKLLQPIRDAWGRPIKITSGFRCAQLNKAVGGSMTSVHKIGYAADIKPTSGTYADFEKFVIDFLKNSDLKWDQVVREKSGNSKWLHIGFKNNAGRQRMMIFDINK